MHFAGIYLAITGNNSSSMFLEILMILGGFKILIIYHHKTNHKCLCVYIDDDKKVFT